MYEYVLENFLRTSTDDWISYKTQLARKNQEITPISLISFTESKNDWHAPEGDEISESDRLRLFIIILSVYRYGIASEILQGE